MLWLFGDTLVARAPGAGRETAFFLRNSLAVQTGLDPTSAFMRFYWRWQDGEARSFLPEDDDGTWFWPMHGVRLDAGLLLFYERLRSDGPAGPSSFADSGWTAVLIDDPDDEPAAWRPRTATLPADTTSATFGEAVLREDGWLYVYGTRGDRHQIVLARFAEADAEAGDLSHPELYCDGAFAAGCAASSLVAIGAPEFSVHHDDDLGAYLLVESSGYGATTLSWRSAPRPEGPWSQPRDVYRPVESFADGAFVYAGKAHPMLEGGGLVATYVPSAFGTLPVATDDRYYYPHFVRLYRP